MSIVKFLRTVFSFYKAVFKLVGFIIVHYPPTYHYFTRIFIWFFAISVTLLSAEANGAWSILIGWFVAVIFYDTHMIGMLILNPFEPTKSSISLDQITRTIEINLLEMMNETEIPEPVKPIDEKYVM